jgi:hypothetical protein
MAHNAYRCRTSPATETAIRLTRTAVSSYSAATFLLGTISTVHSVVPAAHALPIWTPPGDRILDGLGDEIAGFRVRPRDGVDRQVLKRVRADRGRWLLVEELAEPIPVAAVDNAL